MIFAACFELVITHILCIKKSDDIAMGYLAKITAFVQKRLKLASFGADLRPYREKKLKIATLNETDFMVNLKL